MIKNRFFSGNFGVAAEALVAQALDSSAGAIAGSPASGTASVTVATTTTSGDQLVVTVGPQTFTYASAGAVSAAAFGTALLAYLNTHAYSVANSIVWTKAGTTSLVLTATFPNGSQYNGTAFNIEAGPTNAGPSFSSFSSTNATGGTAGTGGSQATYKAFVDSAAAGAVAAYWDDTNLAVEPGSTSQASNSKRKFFYAWKQADGTTMRTSPIPANLSYKSVAYNAGTADVWTVSFGGTIAATQYINVRVLDTTSKTIPYPSYQYQAKVTSTVNAALLLIRDQINTEKLTNDPIVTATVSTTDLVITCTDTTKTIQVIASIEVTSSQPIDASAITKVHTAKAIAPIGTYAEVKEFEKVYLVKNGAILYTGDQGQNTVPSDFQTQASNVVSNINYGYLVVTARKREFPQSSVTEFNHKQYVVVAAPAAAINYLASL